MTFSWIAATSMPSSRASDSRRSLSLLPAAALGLILVLSGSLTGWLLAVVFGPRDFAMPSLMSDLGSVVPRFDVLVACASLATAISAIALGLAPTMWQLLRRPVAATLACDAR